MNTIKTEEKVQRGNSALAVKAGFWYVLSSFLVKGISFLTTPIFSRLMSKGDYGEFSNFASWEATLLVITSLEMYHTLTRAYYDFTEDYDKYVSTVTTLSCGVTLLFYVLFLCFKDFLLPVVSIPEQYIHLMFIALLFQSCKQVFLTRERTLYRYKSVAILTAVNLVIPTGIAIALVCLVPEGSRLSARLYGYYIPSAIIGACLAIPLILRGKSFRGSYIRYALKLSIPLCIQYLTAHLLTSTNTIIAKSMLGAEAAAVVSITSSTIHILTIFFNSVSGALTTWLMDNLEQKNSKRVRKDMMFYVALLAAVSIGVLLLAPEVVAILGGAKYKEAVPLIPYLSLGIFFQSVSSIFTITLTYDKNVVWTAVWTGIIAALSVVTKILLLNEVGLMVLAYTNAAAFMLMFFVNYILVRRAGYAQYMNMPKLLLVGLVVLVLTLGSTFLYSHRFVRYGFIAAFVVVVLVFVIMKRKLIIGFIRKAGRTKL